MLTDEQKKRARAREKHWREQHRDKTREYVRRYSRTDKGKKRRQRYEEKNREKINRQSVEWRVKNPDKAKAIKARYFNNPVNMAKHLERSRKHNQSKEGKEYQRRHYRKRLAIPANRIRFLLNRARGGAPKRGLVFEEALFEHLLREPLPQNCACCGTALDYAMTNPSRHSRGPSVDRIDSTKGYTVQNVAVTCVRCNYAKSDTTLEEARLFVAYMEREIAARGL